MSLASAFAVAARILTELRRSRRVFALWVVFPSVMLVLFGWVRSDTLGAPQAFATTAPGILIGAGFFFSCLGGPVNVLVAERERGTLRRLMATPLGSGAYFTGVLLAQLVVALGQVVLVYGVTFAVGGRFSGSLALGALVLLTSVVVYVGLGFFIAGYVARSAEDVTGAIAGIGVPLLVLGGTFFPTSELPPFLLGIAQADPIFHMNEAFKAVARGAGLRQISHSLAFLVVLGSISMGLGVHSYRRMLRLACAT